MTDKKFKQEDIINALECCIKDDAKYCDDCSYYDEEDEHEQLCVYRLHRDTLDLIARLKARNNQYLLKNTNQRHTLAMLNKQVAELKEELDGKDVEIMRLKHEIERLSQPVFIMETKEMTEEEIKRLLRQPAMVTIKPSDNTIRNETIKEFAELIKKAFPSIAHWIDNLVKEMTEGGAE